MVRLFNKHNHRRSFLLDGLWKFKTDPDRKGFEEKWFEEFPQESVDVAVPSCWNNEMELYAYEGAAWYATTFQNTKRNLNIAFEAVTGQAEVYLDGKHLGGHYGGFTGFNFVLEDIDPGVHILVVYVDNTHNDIDTYPLSKVDWYHYGGITRSVEVMELENYWIKDFQIKYDLDINLGKAKLFFDVSTEKLGTESYNTPKTGNLNVYVNDKKLCLKGIDLNISSKNTIDEYTVDNILLWDIESPNLYNIRFEIEAGGVIIDDVIERIGFRKVEVNGKKILLNGKELCIKGVNRHEDHPDWGFALPLKIMKRDLDILKDMGCNAIRGSHYPNSPVFLDLCDQEGMLFWEEIPMWQYFDRHFTNPVVVERGLKMHEEMVKRDYHHPSIILWGMHNEVESTCQSAYEVTKKFVSLVKELDQTRPITFASCRPMEDICMGLVDIISINAYLGWYRGGIEEWPVFLDEFKQRLKSLGLSDMPLLISEFGAGAVYGEHTFEGPKWTENYQEKYLDYTLNLFLSDPDISGVYIWQYCDIRTARELELGRPRSFNNKGIVNEYRKPKLAYWTVKRIFGK